MVWDFCFLKSFVRKCIRWKGLDVVVELVYVVNRGFVRIVLVLKYSSFFECFLIRLVGFLVFLSVVFGFIVYLCGCTCAYIRISMYVYCGIFIYVGIMIDFRRFYSVSGTFFCVV